MLTYLAIGLIVQSLILIERFIRLPDVFNNIDYTDVDFWISFSICLITNVLVWPCTIICEIFNIINKQ